MAARALIVAIEDYTRSEALHGKLEGTNEAAKGFYEWLAQKKRVEPANILCCGDPVLPFRTAGTTRPEIVAEIRRLRDQGKDQTEELYVYLSGHGFTYTDQMGRAPVDVLVGADFERPQDSGTACIKLDELQEKLRFAMGPGNHYYFVDACRNPLRAEEIDVPSLGVVLGNSNLGHPTWYTLYSTAPGATADVRSGFARALTEALSGRGRAKTWQRGKLWVTFELLCTYVKSRLQMQEVDSNKRGPGEGLIMLLEPPPQSRCEVRVEGADPDDTFTLTLASPLGAGSEHRFSGDSFAFDVAPFDYYLTVSHPASRVEQLEPPPGEAVDLYDGAAVRFRKDTAADPAGAEALPGEEPPGDVPMGKVSPAANATVRLDAPTGGVVSLENLETGAVVDRPTQHTSIPIEPGLYRLKVREHGVTVSSRRLEIPPGGDLPLDLPKPSLSTAHHAILEHIPGEDPENGVREFAESLGPTVNTDLGLWLSLIGASRIAAPPHQRGKLAALPLERFDDVRPGDSPVYVLGAFEGLAGPFQIALDGGRSPEWRPLGSARGVAPLFEARLATEGGAHLLSFQAEHLAPRTYAVQTFANRATLVTFSSSEGGTIEVHQYALPLWALLGQLAPSVLGRLPADPLPRVRVLYTAQKQFARHREVQARLQGDEVDSTAWRDLTYSKWLDPVMSLMAAHELIRTRPLESTRNLLETIVRNLRRHFPGMADVEALALCAGMEHMIPSGAPLLLDSVLAFEAAGLQIAYPLPQHRIDFSSSWTCWVAAVQSAPQGGAT